MHWALIFGRMLHALCAFCSNNKNLLYIYFPSQGRSRRVFWYNITFAGWKSAHRCDNMFSMIFGSCQRSHIAPVHRLFARTLFSRLRSHVYMTILFFYDEKKTCLPVWIWMDRLFFCSTKLHHTILKLRLLEIIWVEEHVLCADHDEHSHFFFESTQTIIKW